MDANIATELVSTNACRRKKKLVVSQKSFNVRADVVVASHLARDRYFDTSKSTLSLPMPFSNLRHVFSLVSFVSPCG
ncbi:hypothetical protein Y032_0150g2748 [Ancylostoma ceylanicum]|uniref:Uncharacterized protein n=1 Tax=Ancylostoma ceylanicum TaxID=53326 RepID=A0A016T165_9BILA|nr:hypothetical protein Y032_0150g2748 [Ancylostoma ceylanicum]